MIRSRAVAVALSFLPFLAIISVADDGIVLMLNPGPSTGQVTLQWSGGGSLDDVYRSATPQFLQDLAHRIGQTSSATWTDAPPAGAIYFYAVGHTGSTCDPTSPAAVCGADMHCLPHPDHIGTCSGPTGGGVQGAPCVDDSGCASPYACIFNGSNNVCLAWCRRIAPACSGGATCQSLTPQVFVGSEEYGVCF